MWHRGVVRTSSDVMGATSMVDVSLAMEENAAVSQFQPGEILPGTVYRVVRHLATGGMGSVYDVEDITVEKRYVLKTLHPNLVTRQDLAQRMRDEAKSLARLHHPNIVDVVTAGVTTTALPFYVMERLVGQNLRVVLSKTSVLQLSHAYRIAIDVADALEHAHENNIVHRDVKPENIFLHRNANGTTTTKLLDFGVVRLLDRKVSQTHGKFIGTLRYASPEQIVGQKVGPATDIYALGIVLFEMLCGRGPFDHVGDAYAVGAAHANDEAPPLSRFARVPLALERLVASALAKDPAARPRDCFSFARELRRILREEEASPKSATAVNLLSSTAPSTMLLPRAANALDNGQTVQGMIPPSSPDVASPDPRVQPTERLDYAKLAGPVAPTLVVAGALGAAEPERLRAPLPAAGSPPLGAGSPAPLPAVGSPPPGAGSPAPLPAAGRSPSGEPVMETAISPFHRPSRPVDRNAPTRVSAPMEASPRQARNDTQLIDPVDSAAEAGVSAHAPLAEQGGRVGSASENAEGGPVGALALELPSTSASTGPLATRARSGSNGRGAVVFVGIAAVLAVVMVGGAFAIVKRSWSGPDQEVSEAIEPSASVSPRASSVSEPAAMPDPKKEPPSPTRGATPTFDSGIQGATAPTPL